MSGKEVIPVDDAPFEPRHVWVVERQDAESHGVQDDAEGPAIDLERNEMFIILL